MLYITFDFFCGGYQTPTTACCRYIHTYMQLRPLYIHVLQNSEPSATHTCIYLLPANCYAHHMVITWSSHVITWSSHGHHMPIMCPSHAHHMPITWSSHAVYRHRTGGVSALTTVRCLSKKHVGGTRCGKCFTQKSSISSPNSSPLES